MKAEKGFEQAKKELLWMCVIVYTVSYLCRTNLSLVLNDLIELLGVSRSTMGFLGTTYFWTYACGQLISGWLGSRYNPKYLICAGLLASGLCNLLIGFSHGYAMILALWMLNGLSLSMIWSPMVEIATHWYAPSEYARISILLNLPTTVGYLLSWGLLGVVRDMAGWRWVFYLPAVIAVGVGGLWMLRVKNFPVQAGFQQEIKPLKLDQQENVEPDAPLWRMILTLSMLTFAVIVLVEGSTKESINLWAPTLLREIGGTISPILISGASMVIPLFSTAGLLVTGWVFKRFQRGFHLVLTLLLLGGGVFGWMLVLFHQWFPVALGSMGMMMGVIYGTTAILTTLIPLRFASSGRSAQITGILNFLAYLGAAVGGLFSGWISDLWGWETVYLLWAVLGTAAFLIMLLFAYSQSRAINKS